MHQAETAALPYSFSSFGLGAQALQSCRLAVAGEAELPSPDSQNKPGTPFHEIMAYLRENRVVAAERLGQVRFAPYIYISPDQIDAVIQLLSGYGH